MREIFLEEDEIQVILNFLPCGPLTKKERDAKDAKKLKAMNKKWFK